MKNKEYEVTLRCGVLMTNSVVRVTASSEEEAVQTARSDLPYSSVVDVVEVQDG